MSIAGAVSLLQDIDQQIDDGRLENLSDVKIAVKAAISMLDDTEELTDDRDEDLFELLLELESLNEKRAKCEARLAKFQGQAQQQSPTYGGPTPSNYTANTPRSTAAHPAAEGTTTSSTNPSASFPPDTTNLQLAVVTFPGGPRTVTIHPPGSPNFQSTIRDENGDTIVVLEPRKQTNPLRRSAAFYCFKDAKRAATAEVYGRWDRPREASPVPPAPHSPDRAQSSQQAHAARPRPSTTGVPKAESRQAETFAKDKRPETPHPAPTKQDTRQPLKRCGARHTFAAPRAPTPSSPSLGRGKDKERARDDEDTQEVEELLTSRKTIPRRTDERVEEPEPSLPRVLRPRVAKATDQAPTTSKPTKRAESSRAEKPAPAKRRRQR